MNHKRLGPQTVALASPPAVLAFASIGGKMESQGPLASYFDELATGLLLRGKDLGEGGVRHAEAGPGPRSGKGGLSPADLDYILAGDLLNQCIGSSFGLREFHIPFYGLYGACSTMGESLSLAALPIDGGYADRAAALTSSHFCTAERQYRMPVPYGSQRTPTAQWTATAAGCTILGSDGPGPYVTHVTCGKIVDKGIPDANNMGAAMAPAAYDTLSAFFRDTGTTPQDYDAIFTGDLGELGHAIVRDFFRRDGMELDERYPGLRPAALRPKAAGYACRRLRLRLLRLRTQRIPAHPDAPGPLAADPLCPHRRPALPAPTCQGESIPSICHAVCLSAQR